ncbi:CRISPR system precrRNA processing endoribonuclease RAMP protein Cas6 [Myxococcota bacterium]|nr:CRISPR system precrRNA processing endoribonuclease RAMP protein Cas6 [Myxococcota bacterium]
MELSQDNLRRDITTMLSGITLVARRLSLDLEVGALNVPTLRGVWGAALKHLNERVYEEVFRGVGLEHEQYPKYILRQARPLPDDPVALEFITINVPLDDERTLMRAWDIASGMGLGKERQMFRVWNISALNASGAIEPGIYLPRPWPLSDLPVAKKNDGTTTQTLHFDVPLRLIKDKRLIQDPTPHDIVDALLRRLSHYLPEAVLDSLWDLPDRILDTASTLSFKPWKGQRADLHRYSGSQKREVDIFGISGHLTLPDGAGVLSQLISVAEWLHIGKSTVLGMGQLRISGQ